MAEQNKSYEFQVNCIVTLADNAVVPERMLLHPSIFSLTRFAFQQRIAFA